MTVERLDGSRDDAADDSFIRYPLSYGCVFFVSNKNHSDTVGRALTIKNNTLTVQTK